MCDQASLVGFCLASVDSDGVLEGAFPSSALGEELVSSEAFAWPLLRGQPADLSLIDAVS